MSVWLLLSLSLYICVDFILYEYHLLSLDIAYCLIYLDDYIYIFFLPNLRLTKSQQMKLPLYVDILNHLFLLMVTSVTYGSM